jgi:hypothetical protein
MGLAVSVTSAEAGNAVHCDGVGGAGWDACTYCSGCGACGAAGCGAVNAMAGSVLAASWTASGTVTRRPEAKELGAGVGAGRGTDTEGVIDGT